MPEFSIGARLRILLASRPAGRADPTRGSVLSDTAVTGAMGAYTTPTVNSTFPQFKHYLTTYILTGCSDDFLLQNTADISINDLRQKLVNYFTSSELPWTEKNKRKANIDILGLRKLAKLELTKLKLDNFEQQFQQYTGINLISFLKLIYDSPHITAANDSSESANNFSNPNNNEYVIDALSGRDEVGRVLVDFRTETLPSTLDPDADAIEPIAGSNLNHGRGLAQFTQANFARQAKYVPESIVMENKGVELRQQHVLMGAVIIPIIAVTNVIGHTTFASDAVEKCANPEEYTAVGINFNTRQTSLAKLGHTTKLPIDNGDYVMHTVGSYRISDNAENREQWVKNAQQLFAEIVKVTDVKKDAVPLDQLSTDRDDREDSRTIKQPLIAANVSANLERSSQQPMVIIDFKPLKGLPKAAKLFTPHDDKEVFDQHVSIMQDAAERYNNDQSNRSIQYIPMWGNSHAEDIVMSAPSKNDLNNFQHGVLGYLEELLANHSESHKLTPILNKMKEICKSGSKDNGIKLRSKFIQLFTLMRILAAHFPQEFIIIGGCMSAKDRMQSLVYASEIIIQLYHKYDNLDFLDDNGRLIPARLDEFDKDFLKAHVNNVVGYSYLSKMGIGRLNNKNLDLLGEIFANFNEEPFKSLLNKERLLVKTKA